ncbi:MAG: hypothetical protein HYY96_13560 [Candidatus Tectomicrobia bacterium]|nr:hypothetical protein [Candidatus Tectomicrobia bacterium]
MSLTAKESRSYYSQRTTSGWQVERLRQLDGEALEWLHRNGKSYQLETLKQAGARSGTIGGEPCIAFTSSDGKSQHCYRFREKDKARRWSFSRGSKAFLLGDTSHDRLILCEGEWDWMKLLDVGLPAVTSTGGAGTWKKGWTPQFVGKRVVVIYDVNDPDDKGQVGAVKVCKALRRVAAEVKNVLLPLEATGGDVSDFLNQGATVDDLLQLIEATAPFDPKMPQAAHGARITDAQDEASEEETKDQGGNPSQAQMLVELAREANLFHDKDGRAYASLSSGEHRETWLIRSNGFERWLRYRFYSQGRRSANAAALQEALATLEAQAQFEGREESVFLRVARKEGVIYLDLCDAEWRAVELTAEGWRLVTSPPVKFTRGGGMRPLLAPLRGGSIMELRGFLNLSGEDDFRLVVGWLLAVLRGMGPYPVLVLTGEQGSAKSTTARLLRALVDPNAAPARSAPREERDLVVSASQAWILGFDNLGTIAPWLSDALCRMATGGGLGTRKLYTDADEIIFEATRPVLLNAINNPAQRQDLADRSIFVELPHLSDTARTTEDELWLGFEQAQPRILGALLDAVCAALRNLRSTHLTRLPRMADVARWVAAAEEALPWKSGEFLQAYEGNRRGAVEELLQVDEVALVLEEFMEKRDSEWLGMATELLGALEGMLGDQGKESLTKRRGWPRNASTLAQRLRRLAPGLRQVGISVEWDRSKKRRSIIIRKEARNAVTRVTRQHDSTKRQKHQQLSGDGEGDDEAVETACAQSPALQGVTCNSLNSQDDDGGDRGDGDLRDLTLRTHGGDGEDAENDEEDREIIEI